MVGLRHFSLLAILWIVCAPSANAQIATPNITPVVAPPVQCTVPPRTVREIEALVASLDGKATPAVVVATPDLAAATPTPFDAPAGSPISADAGQEISDVVSMFYACQNANDTLRAFALMTDSYVVRTIQVGRIGPAQLAEIAQPSQPRKKSALLAIAINGIIEIKPNTFGLDVIGFQGTDRERFTEYLIVVRDGNEFRIDDEIRLSQ